MEPVPASSKEADTELMFMCSDLYIAAFKGQTDVVIGLLTGNNHATARNGRPSSAARVNGTSCLTREVTADGSTLLHIAAGQGHVNLIAELCHRDSGLLSSVNSALDTPLHSAAKAGHVEAIETIVRLALDYVEEDQLRGFIGGKNRAGDTALHVAARHGHGAAVEMLMKLGSEMASELNGAGMSPLYLAVMSRSVQAVEAIVGYKDASAAGPTSQNALHAAVLQSAGLTPSDLIETSKGFYSMVSNFILSSHLLCSVRLVVKLFAHGSQFKPRRQDHIKKWSGQDIMKWRETTSKNLAIVSTLVATIAFSAVFNVPGSYGSDGKANLNGNHMYNAFVVLDTIAVWLQ
ncbi:hypothetical protein PR202_ga21903 [Eleusine coracana subsp. coracana]|uniref:PGG domain-containing protein n=1 Tax=Eleusine coracana subsp. coracana TaxID=191504 RepID=A0AAV5D2V3_ELECO|nr:hypothetical protein PR202_ga21903 [Eleusine coracana subsp. coracana]